jgi:hypothetical protein
MTEAARTLADRIKNAKGIRIYETIFSDTDLHFAYKPAVNPLSDADRDLIVAALRAPLAGTRTLEALIEAEELLQVAHHAHQKMGLEGQGNRGLPHETRMFAAHFSQPEEPKTPDHTILSGDGRYFKWKKSLKAILSLPDGEVRTSGETELDHGVIYHRGGEVKEREAMREALLAARTWIVANTSSENDPSDNVMYERGWWDRDTKLLDQIDAAIATPHDDKRKG